MFSAVDAQDGQVPLAFAPEREGVYPSVCIGATLVSRARYRGSNLTTHERDPGHSTYWPRLSALSATYALRFCCACVEVLLVHERNFSNLRLHFLRTQMQTNPQQFLPTTVLWARVYLGRTSPMMCAVFRQTKTPRDLAVCPQRASARR